MVGEFKDDKCHGYGVYLEKNGDKYEGDWKNGLKHGKGNEFLGVIFKVNLGVQTNADGSIYTGDFYENWKDGSVILKMIK